MAEGETARGHDAGLVDENLAIDREGRDCSRERGRNKQN